MQKREQRECPRTLKSARRSGQGIDWFAFFVADVQMGFGPFLSVYLTTEKWTNADIGLVFTIGSVIALLGQLPGGALVDAIRREKLLASIAMVAIGISAFCIALWPRFSAVILAQTLHAAASVIIGPALAALSLRLVGHRLIGERLGRNAAFGSTGSVVAAIAMGVCGYLLTSQAVFFVSASMVIPALIALQFVSSEDLKHHKVAQIEDTTYDFRSALKELSGHRPLLILAVGVTLFHLSNAAVLPLVANIITLRSSEAATALVALCIIGPQIIVTLASAPVGRYADRYGRHKLLLIGFASLPIRIVLLAATTEPAVLVTIQILDGISATALGVLVASSIADITEESGNFNLALGFIGIAMGLGAAISTALGGYLAYRLGVEAAFLALASIGLVAFTTVACALPETKANANNDTHERAT